MLCSPYPSAVIESHQDDCQDFVLLVIRGIRSRKEMSSKPKLFKGTALETQSKFQDHVAKQ